MSFALRNSTFRYSVLSLPVRNMPSLSYQYEIDGSFNSANKQYLKKLRQIKALLHLFVSHANLTLIVLIFFL